MSRIESFKRALSEKRAVKIIAGIDNFDVENVKKVVMAASNSGASAIDICADTDIIAMVRQMTDLPLFVSSIVPQELAHAVILGADAVELGNFDALYKKGQTFTASQVLELNLLVFINIRNFTRIFHYIIEIGLIFEFIFHLSLKRSCVFVIIRRQNKAVIFRNPVKRKRHAV